MTHCICSLAQGYYDLPRAITDTVATESDVQMLVRIQVPALMSAAAWLYSRRKALLATLDAVTCCAAQQHMP